jgi:TPR repeat protein
MVKHSFDETKTKAEQGHAGAQCSLGYMYVVAKGVKQDLAQAKFWFEKAAAQGHDKAQFTLGYMYSEGEGVKKDQAQAKFWFEKAAAQGLSDAINALTLMEST